MDQVKPDEGLWRLPSHAGAKDQARCGSVGSSLALPASVVSTEISTQVKDDGKDEA